ncbi:MAG: DUF2309 domain-containing protein [Paludisphaera borealis]|uniref:YbcC family protein n=1 Tax=Paludisphaera borealis TaxID=1387353 RepID=UPI00284208C9|nr:DUF2309 domain-containing protein [Paludisphaera borealis]MDR3618823.1 DUF2309 domain-containing protein [Paludisphaera borealis]
MNDPSVSETLVRPSTDESTHFSDLEHQIEHSAHYLPSQGPITVFVHHNTLHVFEEDTFDVAVRKGATTYGCHPYPPEDSFRRELARGRITPDDLASVLIDDLGDQADQLIGFMGTRYHLRLAMLEHPLRLGTDAELHWLIVESDALRLFRSETPPDVRLQLVDHTRHWVMREYLTPSPQPADESRQLVDSLISKFGASKSEHWSTERWEAFTLTLLWRICHDGVQCAKQPAEAPPPLRHRDFLLQASGQDTDLLVHEVLIRYCGAFLDQGFGAWTLPNRDGGFFSSFLDLYGDSRPIVEWLAPLPEELQRIEQAELSPLGSIAESLDLLGVPESDRGEYITQTLIALRGWAGMLRQMETNAEWTVHPAPAGTLAEFLAVRLILERLALQWAGREVLQKDVDLRGLRGELSPLLPQPQRSSVDQRAYLVFQLAQLRGWSPAELIRLSKSEWARLVAEIESFGSFDRRRVYHLAYERRYYHQVFNALIAHPNSDAGSATGAETAARPAFQTVHCLDEREESLRRHLEEVDPDCETFGVAGFYGVAMYYRGVAEAHYRPLCPVNIKPTHYIREVPLRSLGNASRFQELVRRGIGRISHRLHIGSRSLIGGFLTGVLGSLATIPLVMRVLLPRRTARLRRFLSRIMTPPLTQLTVEQSKQVADSGNGRLGYTLGEMTAIVDGLLRGAGMTSGFAPLVIVAGHGSSSLNNPQEAAHDCGACGGARGGPNARAFAQMANDPRVRRGLAEGGLTIPDDVHFVGGYHNTCDDGFTYFDLDRLPSSHEAIFKRAFDALEEARKRDAHERCRRFESAPLTLTFEEALRHVEGRAEDLSQTRPEYGHATNAVTYVGRRSRTRNLFMDRRAFLTSYDASQDDDQGSILRGLMRAVVPVCGGISLEYYFSRVDPTGYGCGTKLPHNISALIGVMDGAASDLRPGLPWQMVEIHEPMRMLFIVETTPEILAALIAADLNVERLVRNGWVHMATLDYDSPTIRVYRDGRFQRYDGPIESLPTSPSSSAWYRGWRDYLGFASILPSSAPKARNDQEPRS